jgi:hypothetical protein
MMLHSSNFRLSILASVMASHWQRTSDKERKNECAIPTSSLTFLSCLSSENSSVRPKFPITSSPNPALRLGVHTDPTCMASDTNATSCRLSGSARDEAGEQHVKKKFHAFGCRKRKFLRACAARAGALSDPYRLPAFAGKRKRKLYGDVPMEGTIRFQLRRKGEAALELLPSQRLRIAGVLNYG